jgi:hypothetical protein
MRHIEQQSDAEVAYDTADDSAASCGKGAWRVNTDYVDDKTFDQEIRIERILNRFSVYPDPAAQKWDYSDGRWFFVTEDMPTSVFKAAYPDAALGEWEGSEQTNEWIGPDTRRVAEYFYKKEIPGTVYEIEYQDGAKEVVNELPKQDEYRPYIVNRSRKSSRYEIWWAKMSGNEVLEGPVKLPGSYYPIVVLWGKELVLDKKRIYRGVVRFAKDPQKLYNYSRSSNAEQTSLAPKVPYIVTPKMIQNHEDMWKTANEKNWPYLLVNPDAQAAWKPTREASPPVNSAIHQEMMIADQEIHDTTGLQQASLGERSNEKSGIAITARQRKGDIANFAYANNFGRALKYTGKVVLDLIPKIYDTARIVRILGPDGAEKMVKINQQYQNEKGEIVTHDLGIGKYDCVVTLGPSYETRRQESGDSMIEFIKAVPGIAPLVMDLVAKNQDWPGAEQFEERIKKTIDPKLLGEEGPQDQQQAQPTPADMAVMAKMQLEGQKLELARGELELKHQQFMLTVEKTKAEIENLRAQAIEKITKAQTEAQRPDLEREKMFVETLNNDDDRMHEHRMALEQMIHQKNQGGLPQQAMPDQKGTDQFSQQTDDN